MEQWMEYLTSPAFWIGTVVVGVIINFVTKFIERAYVKGAGAVGRWKTQRSSAAAERWKRRVEAMSVSREALRLGVEHEMRLLMVGVTLWALGGSTASAYAMAHNGIKVPHDGAALWLTFLYLAIWAVAMVSGLSTLLESAAWRDAVRSARTAMGLPAKID